MEIERYVASQFDKTIEVLETMSKLIEELEDRVNKLEQHNLKG